MAAKYLPRFVKPATKHIQKINAQAERLLDQMSLHKPAVLARPPVKEAWTPLQVLHHITLVERSSVDYLLYKFGTVEEADLPSLKLKHRLSGKLIALSLVSPLKFKSPAPVDSALITPAHKLTLDGLAHDMRATRNELERLLTELPEAWHKTAAFKHPRGGRISLTDMMLFLRAHQDRHVKQIRRGLSQNARYYRRKEAS